MRDYDVLMDEIVNPKVIEWVIRRIDFRGDDECWIWTGAYGNDARGIMYYQGHKHYAYRIVFRICNGSIPQGNIIMHLCDNGSCVNPKHLICGTQQENVDDMYKKGRDRWSKTKNTQSLIKLERRI